MLADVINSYMALFGLNEFDTFVINVFSPSEF